MAADTGPYSRAQFCRKYGITDKTFRDLERAGDLQLEWESRNGLLVASVADIEQRRILTAARNHIATYGRGKSFARVPFQRFLFLRFLQVPVEDLYCELVERHLIHARGFPITRLKAMRKAFITEVPRPLRKRVEAYEAPSTAVEQAQLDILLRVCGIELAYNNPVLEQSFSCMSDPDVKLGFDIGLSTQAVLPEVQAFLEDVASITISQEGLLFYQLLFHDIPVLDSEEVQDYLKTQKPSHRGLLQQAIGQPISSLRTIIGLQDNTNEFELLLELKSRAMTDVLAAMLQPKTAESRRDFNTQLKNLLMLIDRTAMSTGPGGPGAPGSLPSVFDRFELKTSTMSSNLFQIPSTEPADKANHG